MSAAVGVGLALAAALGGGVWVRVCSADSTGSRGCWSKGAGIRRIEITRGSGIGADGGSLEFIKIASSAAWASIDAAAARAGNL